MNNVALIGRLTKDPELKYTQGNQMAITTFSIAVDRPYSKDKEKKADFIRISTFGTTAENCERFLGKGRLVGIQGRIHTDSYKDKDGKTVHTTDVTADRVEFLDRADKNSDIPEGFMPIEDEEEDEEVPF